MLRCQVDSLRTLTRESSGDEIGRARVYVYEDRFTGEKCLIG